VVDLENTTIIATADHSHVFNIAGYPLRPATELPYSHGTTPDGYLDNSDLGGHSGLMDVVYDINVDDGSISASGDSQGVPYTVLGYLNGPGYRAASETRQDPRDDSFPGQNGSDVSGPEDTKYLQESAVPLDSETHSAEEVAIYGIGPEASQLRGTVRNSFIASVMRDALSFSNPN
jgi:alkaline phosphatase